MATVCVDIGKDVEIQAYLTETEALMTSFALEFGQKCGIFSMIDSLLDAAKEFVEPLEQALKQISDVIRNVYNQLKNVIDQIVGVVEEAVAMVKNFMLQALATLNQIVDAVNGFIGDMMNAIAEATNALASALCNTLNSAITGLPSDVVLKTPGLAAAAYLDRNDPRKFLKEAMDSRVNEARSKILAETAKLEQVAQLPNMRAYSCRVTSGGAGTIGTGGGQSSIQVP